MRVKTIVLMLVGILFGASLVYADSSAKRGMSLQDKLMKKLHLIYDKTEELEITKGQLKDIKVLKIALKKEIIKKSAEIELVAIDIKSMMYDERIDLNKINPLVDKKYELKKEKTKSLIKACSELKMILTAKQKEKMKKLFKAAMNKGQKCNMSKMKGMKGHGK